MRNRMQAVVLAVMALVVPVVGMADAYSAFRQELRAFYPEECHQSCKDPRQTNSVAKIGAALDAWVAQGDNSTSVECMVDAKGGLLLE